MMVKTKMNISKIYQTKKNVGQRIDIAISLTGVPQGEFCQSFNIPQPTLLGWKNGNRVLSEKGAEKIIQGCTTMGVICSKEWLLQGIGFPPQQKEDIFHFMTEKTLQNIDNEGLSRSYEIEAFSFFNAHTLTKTAESDSMSPEISKGDFVGGVKLDKPFFPQAYTRTCLVKLEGEKLLIRRFFPGTLKNRYKLVALNPFTEEPDPILYDQEVLELAPVVLIRKEEIVKK